MRKAPPGLLQAGLMGCSEGLAPQAAYLFAVVLHDRLGLQPGGLGVRRQEARLDAPQGRKDSVLGRFDDAVDAATDEVSVVVNVNVFARQPTQVGGHVGQGTL